MTREEKEIFLSIFMRIDAFGPIIGDRDPDGFAADLDHMLLNEAVCRTAWRIVRDIEYDIRMNRREVSENGKRLS